MPFYTLINICIGVIMSDDPVKSFMLIFVSSMVASIIAFLLFRKDIGRLSQILLTESFIEFLGTVACANETNILITLRFIFLPISILELFAAHIC